MDRTVIHLVSREWGNVTLMVLRGGLGLCSQIYGFDVRIVAEQAHQLRHVVIPRQFYIKVQRNKPIAVIPGLHADDFEVVAQELVPDGGDTVPVSSISIEICSATGKLSHVKFLWSVIWAATMSRVAATPRK